MHCKRPTQHLFCFAARMEIGRVNEIYNHRRTWNAGACCGRAAKENVDDLAFLSRVIDEAVARYSGDPNRVYITGISNGAMMAYRMACEKPSKVAAIAPVAGTLAIPACPNGGAVPVLHIHGGADSNVPLQGGEGRRSIAGVKHRSVGESINMITSSRGCESAEQEAGDREVFRYRCERGAPVELWVIKGGQHVWPGGKSRREAKAHNGRFSGSEAVWKFASQFSK